MVEKNALFKTLGEWGVRNHRLITLPVDLSVVKSMLYFLVVFVGILFDIASSVHQWYPSVDLRKGTLYNDYLPSIIKTSIDPNGLSVLSFRLARGHRSAWVDSMFNSTILNAEEHRNNSYECAMELLVAVPFHLWSPHTSKLTVSKNSNNKFTTNCRYKSVSVHWEHRDDSSKPHRPAFFYCPFWISSVCEVVYSYSADAELLVDDNTTKQFFVGSFKTNAPRLRSNFLSSLPTNLSSSTSLCVGTMTPNKISQALFPAFVQHHDSLGMKPIAIFDSQGMHANNLFVENPVVNSMLYFNFTIWDILGKDYANSRRNHVHRRDQDKAITYSYCRFELSSSEKEIIGTLVVDLDEFLSCDKGAKGLETALTSATRSGVDTLVLMRSFIYNVSSIPSCFYDKSKNNSTIMNNVFSCFESWSHAKRHNALNSHKSLHLGFPCPFTGIHASCTSYIHPNNECGCHSQLVKEGGCHLIHFTQ